MMSTDEAQCASNALLEPHRWPVPLLGCLGHEQQAQDDGQVAWPWVLLKAFLCPATVLAANETLLQEEGPADICCLQPYSFSGPTCRDLNAQYCGFGNEGVKLCASMCMAQLLCSCACLGWPCMAWWAALQRQRAAAKHSIQDDEDPNWLSTALFPCSLLQIHVLLRQQQQQQQQQQQRPSSPHRAPTAQRMTVTAGGGDCLVQVHAAPASSGPLVTGMSHSKLMRSIRANTPRSDSVLLKDEAGSTAGSKLCEGYRVSSESACAAGAAPSSSSGIVQCSQSLQLDAQQGVTHTSISSIIGCTTNSAMQQQRQQHSCTNSRLQLPRYNSRLSNTGASSSRSCSGAAASPCPAASTARGSCNPELLSDVSSGTAGACLSADDVPSGISQSRQQPQTCYTGNSISHMTPACGPTDPLHGEAAGSRLIAKPTAALQSTRLSGSVCSTGSGPISSLQLSQEDVPLLALRTSLPRGQRSSLCHSSGAGLGPDAGPDGSLEGSLASNRQHQPNVPRTAGIAAADSNAHLLITTAAATPAGASAASAAGFLQAALAHQQQYATCDSDICNYASWLAGAGPSTTSLQQELPQHEHLQHQQQQPCDGQPPPVAQQHRQPLPPLTQEDSELLCRGHTASRSNGCDAPAAAGAKAQPPDWAYMSDLCVLGRSYYVSNAASMAHCQMTSKCSNGSAGGDVPAFARASEPDSDANPLSSGSSNEAVVASGGAPAPVAAAAVAGKCSEVAKPSPGQQQRPQQPLRKSHHRIASGSWPDAAPSPQSTLTETTALDAAAAVAQQLHSPSLVKSHSSLKSVVPVAHEQSAAPLKTCGGKAAASSSGGGGNCQSHGPSSCVPQAIDRHLLAAVTGKSSTEHLTASQEELAAKLAKLALANPGAARQLACKPREQQQCEAGAAGGEGEGSAFSGADDEPFHPTMMSDICNLGEPVELAAPSLLCPIAESDQQQQPDASWLTGHHTPMTSGARGGMQQQLDKTSRRDSPAGCSAAGGLPLPPACAGAAAAGPLQSAMLKRGQRGAKPQLLAGLQRTSAGRASRASRPGVARQAPAAAAGNSSSLPANPAQHGVAATTADDVSVVGDSADSCMLESFDSYYPDCDIKFSRDFDAAAEAEAAYAAGGSSGSRRDCRGGVDGSPEPHKLGKTYTVTPGGMLIETPGVSQFESAAAAAGPARHPAVVAAAAGTPSPTKMPLDAAGAPAGGSKALSPGRHCSRYGRGGQMLPSMNAPLPVHGGDAGLAAGHTSLNDTLPGTQSRWSSSVSADQGQQRSGNPVAVVGVRKDQAEARAAARCALPHKRPSACISLQTSTSLWPAEAAEAAAAVADPS